jgi:transcriptional regulator of acetoin/glycerol metabolism
MSTHLLSLGKKAWEQYLEKDVLDSSLVRGAVASSWQRCRDLNVNPLLTSGDDAEELRQLEQRRYEKEHLIQVARPFLRDLSYFVGKTDFQVILTDENGLLLEVAGDARAAARAQEVHLCAGADWSEARKGTNAIGTAIFERAPVQIHAWEHFRAENQFLTCSAAPIIDPAGNIVGVIDISGDCRHANPHTLGMVVASVHAIENQLRLEQAMNKLSIASRYSKALVHGITDGLLAIDTNGIVTEINARGGEIFGINPALAKGLPLVQLYRDENAPILQVVRSGKEYKNQEIVLCQSGRHIQSSASLLRDEDGAILGAVAFFRELQTQQFARRGPVFFAHRYAFDDIVGNSPAMQKAKDWASLAATCTSTVLILGESGTGKEIFANAIHNASSRNRGPFLAINCAAMPEGLIESELFGYTDGSFTGAKKGGQSGKFEMANGGTIFLDEIGEMSLGMQSKLLRVLQERTVSRIGSSQDINVDIRVIAATHCDLSKDIETGRFREDLYYRLAVLEVKIPPPAGTDGGHSHPGPLPDRQDLQAPGAFARRAQPGLRRTTRQLSVAGQRAADGKRPRASPHPRRVLSRADSRARGITGGSRAPNAPARRLHAEERAGKERKFVAGYRKTGHPGSLGLLLRQYQTNRRAAGHRPQYPLSQDAGLQSGSR